MVYIARTLTRPRLTKKLSAIWMPHKGAKVTPINARKLPNFAKKSSGMRIPMRATGAERQRRQEVVHEHSWKTRKLRNPSADAYTPAIAVPNFAALTNPSATTA